MMGINVKRGREELPLFQVLFNWHEIHQTTLFTVYHLTCSSLTELKFVFCLFKEMPQILEDGCSVNGRGEAISGRPEVYGREDRELSILHF